MALITFIGGDETGNVAHCDWGRFRFTINTAVECDDPHIIAKASTNRFFRVEGSGGKAAAEVVPDDPADDPEPVAVEPEPIVVKLDPLAKARAAKAAKRAADGDKGNAA